MKTSNTIKLLLNSPLRGKPKGSKVIVPVNASGRVIDQYWASRIKDAEIDNCVSIIESDNDEKNIKKTGKK